MTTKCDPKVPCKQCAFRRDIEPGALGGSEPEVYIGQTNGPFYIPCHCHYTSDTPNWKAQAMQAPQCAGSRVFRANIENTNHPSLLGLEANHELVFSSAAEFIAHHRQISIEQANDQLAKYPPDLLTQIELSKAEVRRKT